MIANKNLLLLTASDLMSTNLVMVPQNMSLQSAARLLSRSHVSGAPVVDDDGRFVGVVSSTDFVHWAENGPKRSTPKDCVCSSWQLVDTEALPRDEVCQFMTTDPVTVPPATKIADVAHMMLDAHIHRVIVVDENARPTGLVSSTDILAAVAFTVGAADAEPETAGCSHFQ